MQEKAYAKINLCLDIIDKRKDGYHNLDTVMQTVDLYDTLTINVLETKNRSICITTNDKSLPTDHNNLVYKAVDLFLSLARMENDVQIHLEKNIPVAAGLGGGSSDAACVLNSLNKLTGVNIKKELLCEESKKIGADIPFALFGGTARVKGIGELIDPIYLKENIWLVLICPNISVSTKVVFQKFIFDRISSPEKTENVVKALSEGDNKLLGANLFNRLESVTIKDHPVIGEIKSKIIDTGAFGAVMSGSGPSVFGIYADKQTAIKAHCKLNDIYRDTCWSRYLRTMKGSCL